MFLLLGVLGVGEVIILWVLDGGMFWLIDFIGDLGLFFGGDEGGGMVEVDLGVGEVREVSVSRWIIGIMLVCSVGR